MINRVLQDLKNLSQEEKRAVYMRFFKTGPGEYGEGDLFWGITVPNVKSVAKSYYKDISLIDIEKLLHNPVHEVRLCALEMMVLKYSKAEDEQKREIVALYLSNLEFVNNWDLVDLSCYKILGDYVLNNPSKREILFSLASSNDLWKQRVSVVSCMALIRNNEFEEILELSRMFLSHKHDLIHKAVGWMLREVGKRDLNLLREFLNENVTSMPRTMLRYSIEKMDEKERKKYLTIG